MRGVEHKGHEELVLLELVLQLHGEFRSVPRQAQLDR
jgi:hypothetical protein